MTSHPPGRIRPLTLLLVVLALGLAFAGQQQFDSATEDTAPLSILAYFGLAAGCLLGAGWLVRRSPAVVADDTQASAADADPEPLADMLRQTARWRLLLAAGGCLLGMYVVAVLYASDPGAPDAVPVLVWLLAVLAVVGAWLPRPDWAALRGWVAAHWSELLLLAGMTLLAAVPRLWNLGGAPFALSGDEGTIGQEVRRVLAGEIRNPFVVGDRLLPLPTMSYFWQALFPGLFDVSAWSLRLLNALFGIAAIPALYLLARVLFDRVAATGAALLLAGYHVHVHYSHATINVIFDTVFYPLALAALAYGLTRRTRALPFVLAGLLAGLAQYTNVGARLLPLMMLAFLAAVFVLRRHWLARREMHLSLLVVVFLVTAGPMLLYALTHPDEYNARLNQVGIVQNGWLEREQDARDVGAPTVLAGQFTNALFGFGIYEDRTESYRGGTLANPAMAVLLFLGLGLALAGWRHPQYTLLSIWFWGALLTGGVLTLNPPTSNRLVVLLPVVALLAALALSEGLRLLLRLLAVQRVQHWALLAVGMVTLPLALLDMRYYVVDYLPQHRFGGINAYLATTLGYELAAAPESPHLYFFGPPRMWSGFASLGFLAPDTPRTDIEEPLYDEQRLDELVEPNRDALFVFLPERSAELQIVQRRFPAGEVREARFPVDGSTLFVAYSVPQAQLADE